MLCRRRGCSPPGSSRTSLTIASRSGSASSAFDAESFTSATSGGLINGTFGWATVLAANMISGGPAYPLAAPGVRVAIKPTDEITLLGAILSGDPAGRELQ